MKIAFYGAGKVGVSLGLYFKSKGLELTGYYSRTFASAEYGAKVTETRVYKNLEELIENNDIIFITVTDSAVKEGIEALTLFNIRDKIIINTSGSLSSKVLSNSEKYGAYFYSLHPIYPFSDKENSYKELNKGVFSLEGDIEKLNEVKELIEILGNKVILIKDEKPKYHLACSIASNLQLALTKIACDYLVQVGFSEKESIEALYPLMEKNLQNIRSKGFLESLTGPIVRGDEETVQAHLNSLEEKDLELYNILGKELLELSIKKNGTNTRYENLEKLLGGE